MSQDNIELHRRAYEAFNARDIERFITYFDPRIEWHSVMTVPGGAVYHGHEGVRRWLADLQDAWGDELMVQAEAYFDLAEHTLSFAVMHGRGRQSGVEAAMPMTHLLRWRDGLGVYFKAYAGREEALSDLGVTEGALRPIGP
jgi:ketosteroid isomerase-like protein